MGHATAKVGRELRYLAGFFKERPASLVGLILCLIFFTLMFVGQRLAPYDPESPAGVFLQPPNFKHWLGTDRTGLDIFSRIIAAPQINLTIGFVATIIAAAIGVPVGVTSGYMQNWFGNTLARVFDVLQCLPPFVLAMCLVAVAGQSTINVIAVLAILNAPLFARLVRAKAAAVQQRKFVEAAICLGNPPWRIIMRHLIPNSLEPVLIQFPVNVGWAVRVTAGLSFIGAGVRVPTPEWGSMVSIGAPLVVTGQWWVALFPGIAMGLCVLGLALLANALEVLLDPKRN